MSVNRVTESRGCYSLDVSWWLKKADYRSRLLRGDINLLPIGRLIGKTDGCLLLLKRLIMSVNRVTESRGCYSFQFFNDNFQRNMLLQLKLANGIFILHIVLKSNVYPDFLPIRQKLHVVHQYQLLVNHQIKVAFTKISLPNIHATGMQVQYMYSNVIQYYEDTSTPQPLHNFFNLHCSLLYFIILLCLIPDNITCQGDSAGVY